MLQIRLNKGSAVDGGPGAKSLPAEAVTVACPDHLILADLPVANGLGSATMASVVKIVGQRSRRQLGERVHFCVRCDFPIAIYGRLSPCEHAFCLDCARSDSICYLCDERIQKIQTIKIMEGIFVCAAPHCLKSFLKKTDFESHIHDSHSDLLQPNMKEDELNEPDASGTKQSSSMDTTLRGSLRPGLPPSSNAQLNDRDREDKARRPQPREPPPPRPVYGLAHPSETQLDNWPMGISGSAQTRIQQQSLDPHREYPPLYPQQPPTFPTPPFGFPPFPSDGAPPFYGAPVPYEVALSDSAAEPGSEQGSVLGFAPGQGGAVSFPEGYPPRRWNVGPGNVPFDAIQGSQGILAAQPPPPPPGPPPPHLLQHKHGYYSGDTSNDGKNYGWQSDRRDGFGSRQE